jgi:hypothetical protein
MRKTVKVMPRHIKKGIDPVSNTCCPIALAIKDAFKVDDIYMTVTHVYRTQGVSGFVKDNEKGVALPQKAINFQHALFDRKKVKPFTFVLSLS